MNKEMIRKRRGNEGGFTLLELMIATVILAIGLLGVAGMQIVAINGNYFGKELTIANTLIAREIEGMKGISLDKVISKTEYITFSGKDAVYSGMEPSSGFYYTMVTTKGKGPDDLANTASLEVKVSWLDANGKKRIHKSSTVLFNNDTGGEGG